MGRSPAAARQLASRARRRVQGGARAPTPTSPGSAQVVDAFFAAARGGDFDGLVAVLDPDVVLRVDGGAPRPARVRGAAAVAGQALMFARLAPFARPALVNGAVGMVTVVDGRTVSVMAVTVRDGRIAALDIIADPDRLTALRS